MGFINYLQFFIIGLSFGLGGPCLFSCVPLMVAYIAGKRSSWRQGLQEALIFFSGRLFIYSLLGYLAGLSAALLRKFSNSDLLLLLKPAAGLIIVFLGAAVLFDKHPSGCKRGLPVKKAVGFGSLFVLGFISGVFPCAPFTALLFEIAIISKNAFQGAICAFSFGFGTFISSFVIIAGLSKALSWIPEKIARSGKCSAAFRFICFFFMLLAGLNLILR